MNVRAALAGAVDYLSERGVPSPRVDAELLLGKALGLSPAELYLAFDRDLDHEESFWSLVRRRGEREPLAYVLGDWGFRRLTLRIDRRALVPRPETEVVVERCLALLAEVAEPRVLDVGTGSGAIALAIADEHPGARVTAIDASTGALALAAENVRRTGLPVGLRRRDLSAGLPGGSYDLVVANPPYVSPDEVDALEPEVRDWEPRAAIIDRGQTDEIADAARSVLRPGGWLVLETHADRAAHAARVLEDNHYGLVRVSEDMAGRDRIVEGRWPE